MPEPENPTDDNSETKLIYEYIRDGISYYRIYEEKNGVRWQAGLPPVDEIEFGEDEEDPDYDPDKEYDPEGWRICSDTITWAQIVWLRRHPEHDFGRNVEEWDMAFQAQMARAELANPTPRPPANPAGLKPEVVRELALSLPGAQERDMFGHPAFWVDRVFAILWPQERWVHLTLTVELQQQLIDRAPHIYSPAPPLPNEPANFHNWSKTGATQVDLDTISREEMLAALKLAHSLALPTELVWPK
jgi:hypothetical protein